MTGERVAGGRGLPILYVDDEPHNLELFRMQFQEQFDVRTASHGEEALRLLGGGHFAAVLTDERMPGMSGIALLSHVVRTWPEVVRVIISAYSDTSRVLAAINRGRAHEYILKPWSEPELRACIERCCVIAERKRQLAMRSDMAEALERDLRDEEDIRTLFAGYPGLQQVRDLALRAADTQATVLIGGETGTGKELVARLVHEASPRAAGTFVRVNCGALPEGVIESELFGHEAGAFTGASRLRRGRFELAAGGTIFLDEIGDISPKVQVGLLRVLQEREFERVGGSTTIRTDARVIAATHRNLAQLVRAGTFREDLYYRLNVLPIEIPPLRARPGDIVPLMTCFLRRHTPPGRRVPRIDEETVARLSAYGWPGNARELENMVQRALVLSEEDVLTVEDFCLDLNFPGALTARQEGRNAEADELRRALVSAGGNCARAARALGLARTTFLSRAKRHGLLS